MGEEHVLRTKRCFATARLCKKENQLGIDDLPGGNWIGMQQTKMRVSFTHSDAASHSTLILFDSAFPNMQCEGIRNICVGTANAAQRQLLLQRHGCGGKLRTMNSANLLRSARDRKSNLDQSNIKL